MVATSVPKPLLNESIEGTPFFKDVVTLTTPGIQQELINITVPDLFVRNLHQLHIACRMEGSFKILIDNEVVGSGRTGAATPNVSFSWYPARSVVANKIIKVLFTARPNSPAVDVEAYLQAADISL